MCDPRCGVGVAQPCGWSGRGVAASLRSLPCPGRQGDCRREAGGMAWHWGGLGARTCLSEGGCEWVLRCCRHPVWEALQVESQQVLACQESGWDPGSWRPWRFPGSTRVPVWVGRV